MYKGEEMNVDNVVICSPFLSSSVYPADNTALPGRTGDHVGNTVIPESEAKVIAQVLVAVVGDVQKEFM